MQAAKRKRGGSDQDGCAQLCLHVVAHPWVQMLELRVCFLQFFLLADSCLGSFYLAMVQKARAKMGAGSKQQAVLKKAGLKRPALKKHGLKKAAQKKLALKKPASKKAAQKQLLLKKPVSKKPAQKKLLLKKPASKKPALKEAPSDIDSDQEEQWVHEWLQYKEHMLQQGLKPDSFLEFRSHQIYNIQMEKAAKPFE